jgi:hypothetical protein
MEVGHRMASEVETGTRWSMSGFKEAYDEVLFRPFAA